MVRIKICGITSVEEARLVEQNGADALGVLVGQEHASEDFVSPAKALEIVQQLPPFLVTVWITHLENTDEIMEMAHAIPCPVVQLHSDLSPETLGHLRQLLFPRKIIGKVSVEGKEAIQRAKEIEKTVDAILIDSIDRKNDRVGGTGKVHDWDISHRIVQEVNVPVILAGGLTPDNVQDAIRKVKPWGVDVNSGVDGKNGKKEKALVRRFVENARKASST